MYRNYIKRLLAIILSLGGMICLSWLFLILSVAIKLDSPGAGLFPQKRVGKNKKLSDPQVPHDAHRYAP